MDDDQEARTANTPAGVAVADAALATAEELARLVRAATCDLPFGVEPAAFLAEIERLAPAEGEEPS